VRTARGTEARRQRRAPDASTTLTSEEIVPAVPTPSPGADLSTALAKHTPGPGRFQVPGPLPPSPRLVLSPQLIILIFITYIFLIYTRPRSCLRLSFLAAYTVSPLLLSPMKLCTCLHLLSFYFPAASPIRLVDFDFDYATLSSLDRHATDVGAPKVLSLSFLPMPCHADRFVHSSYSTLLCSRSAASCSRARWAEVDARVEVLRADKYGDADGEGEGEAAGGHALGRRRDP
jgi:hypothetical protein